MAAAGVLSWVLLPGAGDAGGDVALDSGCAIVFHLDELETDTLRCVAALLSRAMPADHSQGVHHALFAVVDVHRDFELGTHRVEDGGGDEYAPSRQIGGGASQEVLVAVRCHGDIDVEAILLSIGHCARRCRRFGYDGGAVLLVLAHSPSYCHSRADISAPVFLLPDWRRRRASGMACWRALALQAGLLAGTQALLLDGDETRNRDGSLEAEPLVA